MKTIQLMKKIFFFATLTLFLQSCIGDDIVVDFVEPTIRINNALDTIQENATYQFEFTYLDNIGREEAVSPTWSSSDQTIISIDDNGLATGLQEGSADITVTYEDPERTVSATITVNVGQNTVIVTPPQERSGTIATTSSYALTGDFTIKDNGSGGIDIIFENNYNASTALPGLYVYLTNNKNTTSSALEIQKVATFSGAHTYTVDNVSVDTYSHLLYFCKPFNVKVGDGAIQ
jgi:hypothetical protein